MKTMVEDKTTFERLDQELIDLYKNLRKKNFEDDEISQIFKPLVGENSSSIRKYIFLLIFASILLHTLSKTETGWWNFLAISRMLLVKIKPFYDWGHLKNQECLVEKWWEKGLIQNYTPNCNLCENLKRVEVLEQLDNQELEDFYMDVHKPVVLRYEGFSSVERLWTDFFQDEFFLTSIPCSQETNVLAEEGTVGKVLRKMSIFQEFFAHFQNCEYESMKYFRKIVPVPDLAPKHISPVQYNWLIWSKNYTFPRFKQIDLVNSENIKMVGQLNGKILFRLVPSELCKGNCKDVEVELEKNYVLFFTNFWKLEYKITSGIGEVENVAVVSEAHSIL